MKRTYERARFGCFILLIVVLLIVPTANPSLTLSPQAMGGPVVLMGIDAEDGGVGGHGPISVYEDVVTSILAEVTNGGSGILVIGGGKDTSPPVDDVTEFWNQIDTDLTTTTVTYVNGAMAIAAQSFTGFAVIAIASSEDETSSGGLTQAENDALAGRLSDIAMFVNGGGGLLGFSQTGFTNPYAYIAGLGAFTTETDLSYLDIAPTTEGTAIGITDDLDICCWHDVFLTFPSFLDVLATQDDATEDFFGEAAALGGAQVVLAPQLGCKDERTPNCIGFTLNGEFGVARDGQYCWKSNGFTAQGDVRITYQRIPRPPFVWAVVSSSTGGNRLSFSFNPDSGCKGTLRTPTRRTYGITDVVMRDSPPCVCP